MLPSGAGDMLPGEAGSVLPSCGLLWPGVAPTLTGGHGSGAAVQPAGPPGGPGFWGHWLQPHSGSDGQMAPAARNSHPASPAILWETVTQKQARPALPPH